MLTKVEIRRVFPGVKIVETEATDEEQSVEWWRWIWRQRDKRREGWDHEINEGFQSSPA